jgi:hypothetical protein
MRTREVISMLKCLDRTEACWRKYKYSEKHNYFAYKGHDVDNSKTCELCKQYLNIDKYPNYTYCIKCPICTVLKYKETPDYLPCYDIREKAQVSKSRRPIFDAIRKMRREIMKKYNICRDTYKDIDGITRIEYIKNLSVE